MNRKLIFYLLVVFGIFSYGFYSCKKESNPNQFDRLVGKWQEVQFATDDNNNGVLDANELHNVDTSYRAYLIFNKDSTGQESITINDSTTVYPFYWQVLYGDSLQRDGIGHDTIIYAMLKISSLSITLQSVTKVGPVWYVYNKK